MPVVEVLSAVAASHPSGILVLERPQRAAAFAFQIERGRVTSALGCSSGSLPLPDLANASPDAGRRLVDEHVLEHLQLTREPGARMIFIRGDVRWLGPSLPAELGSGLEHLLLEHARRWDEEPKLVRSLGDLEQVIELITPPGQRPQSPTKAANTEDDDGDWDFFDDPDPAAESEWQDAVVLYAWCRSGRTLQQILDTSPLGRFRCLSALGILRRGGHIELNPPVPKRQTGAPQAAVIDLPTSERRPRTANPDDSTAAALPRRPTGDTEYVYVRTQHATEQVGPSKRPTGAVGRMVDPAKAGPVATGSRRPSTTSATRATDRMQKMAQALQERTAAERANTPRQNVSADEAPAEAAAPAAPEPHGAGQATAEPISRKKRWLLF